MVRDDNVIVRNNFFGSMLNNMIQVNEGVLGRYNMYISW